MIQPFQHWVVRAGIADVALLKKGYDQYPQTAFYGFSVQYDPQASVDELARAGLFKNRQISVATKQQLELAVQSIGYTLQLIKTPGKGYHHTLMVLYTGGTILTNLPDDAAQTLSQTFICQPNPYPVP